MTLTHDQIAEMTTHEINIAITQRIGPITYDEELDSFFACEYAYDWSHAGRLLEMMAGEASGIPDLISPETISRCWLEWYEVKNAAKNEVKHETK